jgi:hypothetical protein
MQQLNNEKEAMEKFFLITNYRATIFTKNSLLYIENHLGTLYIYNKYSMCERSSKFCLQLEFVHILALKL